MIVAFEIVLAVALAGLSLLVYMMVRQVGVVTRRLPYKDAGETAVVEVLAPGEACPVVDLTSYTGEETFALPLVDGEPSFLLFTSFSCTKCRAIMEGLADLPERVRDRLVVMVLDAGFAEYFAADVRRMNLDRLRLVDAYEHATAFRVQGVPYVYTVDPDHRIAAGAQLASPRDLVKHVRTAPALAPAQGA